MPITDLQAIQRITKSVNQETLKRAASDNDRQRFHALTATSSEDAGPYVATFKDWVRRILSNDEKYARFEQLLVFPLPSSKIIDKASDEYLKAFDAEDKHVHFEFSSDNLKADAGEYLDEIGFDDWLNKSLFNQCLQASGAIWIVDLDTTPNADGYARPEALLREFGQLHDIGVNKKGVIQYVIFPLDSIKDANGNEIEKRWAVIDDESFRVFKKANGDSEASVLLTNPHELARCPAGFIWHDKLIQNKPLRIQSPLHALFTDLDYYVMGWVFRQHVDLYASFPILRSYKARCSYEAPTGETCNNGFIAYRSEDEKSDTIEPCPVCSKKKPIGPGSHVTTPQPQDRESADLSNPVGFVNADRQLLDYNGEKLDAIEAELIEALTGDDGTVDQSTTAVNLDQVQARFEKRKAILSYWAEHLEKTHEEVLEVLFELRYGDSFIGVSVNYGNEFHLLSPGQAIADYDAARKAGLPTYQLMARRTRIDKVLSGSSESEHLRTFILSQLEPYPDLMLASVPMGSDAWELKANFSQYIARFERENLGVEVFGKALSMAKRIELITQTLYQYVAADKAKREVPIPEGQGQGQGFGGK